jgi:uncharacterized protein with PQ loop repeat
VLAGDIALALEAAGAGLAVVNNAPQAWRSCRGRRVEGLSPAARWLAVLQSATWVAYGLTGGGALQVLTNAVCGALHVGVLVAVLALTPGARHRRVLLPQAGAAAAWLALVTWSAGTGGLPVGTLAAACGATALLPQLVRLAADRGAATSGISPATAVLSVTSNACWAGYGLLVGSVSVWAPSLLAMAAGTTTLVLLGPRRPSLRNLHHDRLTTLAPYRVRLAV